MFQADKDYFPAASHSQTVCVASPKEDGKCDTISHYHMPRTHFMCLCWGFASGCQKHGFLRHCFCIYLLVLLLLLLLSFILLFKKPFMGLYVADKTGKLLCKFMLEVLRYYHYSKGNCAPVGSAGVRNLVLSTN